MPFSKTSIGFTLMEYQARQPITRMSELMQHRILEMLRDVMAFRQVRSAQPIVKLMRRNKRSGAAGAT